MRLDFNELLCKLIISYNAQMGGDYTIYFLSDNEGNRAIDYIEALRILEKLIE